MKEQEIVLQVINLTVKLKLGHGVFKVVNGLSYNLYRGKTLAIVGESGCGKTLSALSLMRILPTPPALPVEGQVIYKGENLLSLSEKEMRKLRGAKIAMIFQDPSSALNPVYTIGNQLLEVAELHLGLYDQEAWTRAFEALKEVGISNPEQCLESYPHQISGGMKQRVMIAMALMCEPDILIADEPTTALDVTIQAQVLDLMKKLQKKREMAILLITHDMGVVAEMADDVMVMYATQAVESGNVFQVFQGDGHPYTRALFNSLPNSRPAGCKLEAIKGTVPAITHLPKGCHFHPRCPYAMDICTKEDPPYFHTENHPQVKCWLFDETTSHS